MQVGEPSCLFLSSSFGTHGSPSCLLSWNTLTTPQGRWLQTVPFMADAAASGRGCTPPSARHRTLTAAAGSEVPRTRRVSPIHQRRRAPAPCRPAPWPPCRGEPGLTFAGGLGGGSAARLCLNWVSADVRPAVPLPLLSTRPKLFSP